MTKISVGNPSVLAIESSITQPYARVSQRGLGYFVIYVGGNRYGIRAPDATLLACSLDSVRRRIARRGTHVAPFATESSAKAIVDAFHGVTYDADRQDEIFFGLARDEFRDTLTRNEIVWAPDGDAAFDDGGHVLQFDQDGRVRLIAFRNAQDEGSAASTMAEVWLGADKFYDLLDEWQSEFEIEWKRALNHATKH
jgi:hypothetical protein